MNAQDEEALARKVATALDAGTSTLRQGTAYRLQLARQAAVARMAERGDTPLEAPAAALATSAGTAGGFGRTRHWFADYRLWLAVLTIAGGIYVYNYWAILQQASEFAELDSALLVSDLPLDALLDKGFENWLLRSGQ